MAQIEKTIIEKEIVTPQQLEVGTMFDVVTHNENSRRYSLYQIVQLTKGGVSNRFVVQLSSGIIMPDEIFDKDVDNVYPSAKIVTGDPVKK